MRLEGKVIIVTGSGSGIGRGIALCMAKEGANIVVADINMKSAQLVAEEIKTFGQKAIAVRTDVTSSQDVEAMLSQTLSFGGVDVLVNNAGIAGKTGLPFTNNTEEDWDRVLKTNLISVFITSKAIAPHFISQKSGRIINIASIAGPMGGSMSPPYSVSKMGVITLSKAMARDLAPYGITVNVICPGLVWTPHWEELAGYLTNNNLAYEGLTLRQAFDKRLSEIVPLKREQTPEDVGAAAVFLASQEARNITGHTLCVDGGVLMH